VEWLKVKALSSSPSTTTKKKKNVFITEGTKYLSGLKNEKKMRYYR
jgi:hypothetical protein